MKKKYFYHYIITGIILMAGLSSCEKESDYEKQVSSDDAKVSAYLQQNNIVATKDPEGFYYEELSSNVTEQRVEEGNVVAIHYKISTLEGVVLEDLISKDSSVIFRQGTGNMLPSGLDTGIGLMRAQERFRFYIPSYLAYNDYSNSKFFPSYSNFIVEVVVDSVLTETDFYEAEEIKVDSYVSKLADTHFEKFASGLHYSETLKGTGESPLNGNMVKVHFTRKNLIGEILYSTLGGEPATFTVGSYEAVQGLSEGVKQMREGGKAIMAMPSKIAFGASVCTLPSALMNDLFEQGSIVTNVPPYTSLVYEVELIDVY